MVMPVSKRLQIVHGGHTTDPVQLLQVNAKYVPFRLNGETVSAAVEIVSCTAASTLRTIGCGCSAEDAQKIKSRARAGELVYVRPLMSFFAVQNNTSKGKSGKGQLGRKIVRGKMDPCAITFIRNPSDLDKNFIKNPSDLDKNPMLYHAHPLAAWWLHIFAKSAPGHRAY